MLEHEPPNLTEEPFSVNDVNRFTVTSLDQPSEEEGTIRSPDASPSTPALLQDPPLADVQAAITKNISGSPPESNQMMQTTSAPSEEPMTTADEIDAARMTIGERVKTMSPGKQLVLGIVGSVVAAALLS